MIITTIHKSNTKDSNGSNEVKEVKKSKCPYEDPKNSPDWEYMHQCALVDENPPVSWSKFADTASLVKALYADLMNNPNEPKNVYNLSVALLRHWRTLKSKS